MQPKTVSSLGSSSAGGSSSGIYSISIEEILDQALSQSLSHFAESSMTPPGALTSFIINYFTFITLTKFFLIT